MNDLITRLFYELTNDYECNDFTTISKYCDFITYDLADFRAMIKIVYSVLNRAFDYDFFIEQKQLSNRKIFKITSDKWTIKIECLLLKL